MPGPTEGFQGCRGLAERSPSDADKRTFRAPGVGFPRPPRVLEAIDRTLEVDWIGCLLPKKELTGKH